MANLANTTEKARSAINSGVNASANLIESRGSEIMDQVQDLREQAMDAYKVSEKYVRQNPFYFIGGAAVIGLLSGLLLARRK